MAFSDWSTTAGSNTTVGGVSTAEGMNPSDVNNAIRAVMADAKAALGTKGADIASATTTDLGAVAGLFHDITGTTTITGFGTIGAGIWKVIKFEGALTLTHNATSLILPGGANITTANGDIAIVTSEGSGNWRCVNYVRASGVTLIGSSLELATKQASTSGTSIDFTGIPAGTKEIVVMFNGVSTNGSSSLLVQLGDAGGIETSGYVSSCAVTTTSSTANTVASVAGCLLHRGDAADAHYGCLRLTLMDAGTFAWVGLAATWGGVTFHTSSAVTKALSAELDRIRVTTVNGTDTFDAGSINIAYK